LTGPNGGSQGKIEGEKKTIIKKKITRIKDEIEKNSKGVILKKCSTEQNME